MENLTVFLKDENTLLEYSMVEVKAWESLIGKKVSSVSVPTKVMTLTKEEQQKYPNYQSKIELPILRGYKTFYNEEFTKEFNTQSMLQLLKNNLNILKELHNNEIYHTDINPESIIIDKDLNICYIDFESSVIDNYVSQANIYNDGISNSVQIKNQSKEKDKLDLLNLYLYYLTKGNFKVNTNQLADIKYLSFPNNIKSKIKSYQYGEEKPSSDYYFIDIIEDLIKQGYESPILNIKR